MLTDVTVQNDSQTFSSNSEVFSQLLLYIFHNLETSSLWVPYRCLKPKRFRNQLFIFYPNHVLPLNSLVNGMSVLPVPRARQLRSFSDPPLPFYHIQLIIRFFGAHCFKILQLLSIPMAIIYVNKYLLPSRHLQHLPNWSLPLGSLIHLKSILHIPGNKFYKVKICLKV